MAAGSARADLLGIPTRIWPRQPAPSALKKSPTRIYHWLLLPSTDNGWSTVRHGTAAGAGGTSSLSGDVRAETVGSNVFCGGSRRTWAVMSSQTRPTTPPETAENARFAAFLRASRAPASPSNCFSASSSSSLPETYCGHNHAQCD